MRERAVIRIPLWLIGAVLAVAVILGGRTLRPTPNVSRAYQFGMMGAALQGADVRVPPDGAVADALFAVEKEFAARPDLQTLFGTGADLDLRRLLSWAVSDADAGTFRLSVHRSVLRAELANLTGP